MEDNFTTIYEGFLFDGSRIRVIAPVDDSAVSILERNQGSHDERFFILDIAAPDKAIEKCKRIIQRSMENCVR